MHRQANNTYWACSLLINHPCKLSIYKKLLPTLSEGLLVLSHPDYISPYLLIELNTEDQSLAQDGPGQDNDKKDMVQVVGSGVWLRWTKNHYGYHCRPISQTFDRLTTLGMLTLDMAINYNVVSRAGLRQIIQVLPADYFIQYWYCLKEEVLNAFCWDIKRQI